MQKYNNCLYQKIFPFIAVPNYFQHLNGHHSSFHPSVHNWKKSLFIFEVELQSSVICELVLQCACLINSPKALILFLK